MNFDRIIGMIVNTIMRRLVNKGVDSAIDLATRKRSDGKPEPLTEEERARQAQARALGKRARDISRITRRL